MQPRVRIWDIRAPYLMATATQETSRTEHLLALMTKGDDLFNARDWQALDEVHHADMIAHVTGSAEPIYGREAHGAAMQQLVRMFPDIRVHTPYPIQFGGGDWITVVTNVTGTYTGEMTLPDRNVIPPTGKAFDLEFAQTSKWDSDQLIVISAFWEAALQAKQLGLPQKHGTPAHLNPLFQRLRSPDLPFKRSSSRWRSRTNLRRSDPTPPGGTDQTSATSPRRSGCSSATSVTSTSIVRVCGWKAICNCRLSNSARSSDWGRS